MVYCGLFPATHNQFEDLRDALEKLALNDASFTFEPETSDALGFGFRCGFLGMLHMEIIQQRLERESNIDAGPDGPERHLRDRHQARARRCTSPTRPASPTPATIEEFREPIATVNFILPADSHRRDHEALRGPPRDLPEDRVHRRRPASSSSTRCRWPR